VTQELAAKALSTLFDRCDEATQDKIVKELVGGLAGTRTASAAASGGEMATFKELTDIANDAGQPELVYKLMDLSTTSAIWNTRKGVAFALAEQSRSKLEAHMHKLVPTLYRYTFDPNPKIASAMKQVWSALVPEPKKTLLAHLKAVMAHLVDGITSREWRARESSCAALAELLSGRTHSEVGPQLLEIHTRLMRALDDIKDSVRKAALGAWRALASVINRLSDGALAPPAQARAVLDAILPHLLEHGVPHSSPEVRHLCTKQLLQLCKAAGDHLTGHVRALVPALLESLSVVEDPTLNYLQMNAANVGVSDSQVIIIKSSVIIIKVR
jgi:proteasome component ECM29